jgi:hypothetical protein
MRPHSPSSSRPHQQSADSECSRAGRPDLTKHVIADGFVSDAQVPPSLLSLVGLGALSVNQFAIDNVCIS